MKRFGKVAVLMGGFSAEREISLMSGKKVYEALKSQGVDAHSLDVGPDFLEKLKAGNFDRAFNVLHGTFGEDGGVQAILDFFQLPYTGSGVLGSSVSMDKVLSKHLFRDTGVLTPEFVRLDFEKPLFLQAQPLGLPLAIKPVAEGSTLGVSKVSDYQQLEEAVQLAKKYGEVMAERWIEGEEYTVGIINHEVLPSIRIQVESGFYDYQHKYFTPTNRYHCPSGLSEVDELEIKQLAYRAFEVLQCRHWGRVDILRDEAGRFYVLEVNTAPGMTATSLIPKAAAAIGWSYESTVLKILEQTLVKHDH